MLQTPLSLTQSNEFDSAWFKYDTEASLALDARLMLSLYRELPPPLGIAGLRAHEYTTEEEKQGADKDILGLKRIAEALSVLHIKVVIWGGWRLA